MKRIIFIIISIFCISFISCSDDGDLNYYQNNDSEPEYRLFGLLDEYPALKDFFTNLDQNEFNHKTAEFTNSNNDVLPKILIKTNMLLGSNPGNDKRPVTDSIGKLRIIFDRAMKQNELDREPLSAYQGKPANYTSEVYDFIEKIRQADIDVAGSVIALINKTLAYTDARYRDEDIEEKIQELIDDLREEGDDSIADTLDELTELASKLLLQSDENLWLDTGGAIRTSRSDININTDTNAGVGNAVRGIDALLSGMNDLSSDAFIREDLYNLIRNAVLMPSLNVNNKNFSKISKDLIFSMEDWFTASAGLEAANKFDEASDYNIDTDKAYSNAELGNTLKELFPALVGLFIRADRVDSVIEDDGSGVYPLELLAKSLNSSNIDLESLDFESVLYKFVQLDGSGRNRLDSSDNPADSNYAYNVSMLDQLMFLLAAVRDIGFFDRDTSTTPDDPEGLINHKHGHGVPSGGVLTLNDALFSLGTGNLLGFDAYLLALNRDAMGQPSGKFIHRSNQSFEKNSFTFIPGKPYGDHPFFMDVNFPALQFMSDYLIGDAGSPDGGSGTLPTDTTLTENDWNSYRAYNAEGKNDSNTLNWMLGLLARTCWRGEGPYYCANRNGNQQTTQDIDGTMHNVYYSPGGEKIAWVTDAGVCHNNTKYKSEWNTDYYLIELGLVSVNETLLFADAITQGTVKIILDTASDGLGTGADDIEIGNDLDVGNSDGTWGIVGPGIVNESGAINHSTGEIVFNLASNAAGDIYTTYDDTSGPQSQQLAPITVAQRKHYAPSNSLYYMEEIINVTGENLKNTGVYISDTLTTPVHPNTIAINTVNPSDVITPVAADDGSGSITGGVLTSVAGESLQLIISTSDTVDAALTTSIDTNTVLVKLGAAEIGVDDGSGNIIDYYNWTTADGTQTILTGDKIRILSGYSGGGAELNTYEALTDLGLIDLGLTDYSVITDWNDATLIDRISSSIDYATGEIAINYLTDPGSDPLLLDYEYDSGAAVTDESLNLTRNITDAAFNKGLTQGTVIVKINNVEVGRDSDNGDGTWGISGSGIDGAGTIDHSNGAISFNLNSYTAGNPVTVDYSLDHYVNYITGKIVCTLSVDPGSDDVTVDYDHDSWEKPMEDTDVAGCLTVRENPAINNAARECATHEEAIFKNLQWLLTEKKMMLIIPMRIDAGGIGTALYIVVEFNGLLGMVAGGKVLSGDLNSITSADGNGKWAKDGGYGESYEPCDSRMTLLHDSMGKLLLPYLYNKFFGNGTLIPGILGGNIGPVARLAFLRTDANQLTSLEVGAASSYWSDRNAIAPILMATLGELHRQASIAKNPFKGLVNGIIPALTKPMTYYQKDNSIENPIDPDYIPYPRNCWKPRIADGNNYLLPNTHLGPAEDISSYYLPKANPTLLTLLSESDYKKCDGLLPLLCQSDLLTQSLLFLQKLGGSEYDDDTANWDYGKTIDENFIYWGARRKIFYGIEQFITMIRTQEGEAITEGYISYDYPSWVVYNNENEIRDIDFTIEDAIETLITDGLATLPEDYPLAEDWHDYNEAIATFTDLFTDNGQSAGRYNMTEDLIGLMDIILSGVDVDLSEIVALRHTAGVLFSGFNKSENEWEYYSELTEVLTNEVPWILETFKGNYGDLLTLAINIFVDDGFARYLIDNLQSSYQAQEIIEELFDFIGIDLITRFDSSFWNDLAELLPAVAEIMAGDNDVFYEFYNRGNESKDAYSPDPFSALGEIFSK